MNVIFLDFDGVLDTIHYNSDEDVEKRVKLLADITHKYNASVIIEAAAKDAIDEETMEINGKWVNFIFSLFQKYDINCIGRCPNVIKKNSNNSYTPIWKEYEIRLYLFRHPEIEHYCIIDDDDLAPRNSDLNMVRDHLVKTCLYSEKKEEEGLLPKHIEEVGKILKKDNHIRKLVLNKKSKV